LKKPDVICIGISGVDVLIRGVDLEEPFETETKLAKSIDLELGGDAANEAVVLANLGVAVELMSGIGNDSSGDFIRHTVAKSGVMTEAMMTIPNGAPSALNVIIIHPDGERSFINCGAPGAGWAPDPKYLKNTKIVSLASLGLPPFTDVQTCLKIAKEAKESGKIVCADVVYTESLSLEMITPALRYIDYIFPNEDEARRLTGFNDLDDIAGAFIKRGVGHVIVKTGKKGCFIKSKELRAVIPAYQCKNVVDTTGAGDNFLAGFICALLEGKPLIACCRYACGVAAVSIQSRGASTGVKSRQQVENAICEMNQI